MSEALQESCKKTIMDYQTSKHPRIKQRLRNDLYFTMQQFLMVWLKSSLTNLNYQSSSYQLLSWSWEVYVLALEKYHPRYKVASHFCKQCEFFIKQELLDQDGNVATETEEELLRRELPAGLPEESLVERILTVKQFRNSLDENYKIVFDDAIRSLNPQVGYNLGRPVGSVGMSTDRYYEAKKVIKMVITFLLKGEACGQRNQSSSRS